MFKAVGRIQLVALITLSTMIASLCTTICLSLFNPPSAAAQGVASIQGLTLYAGPRRDTMKDESYIFYDAAKGEIWVYRNEKFEKHLRIKTMGEALEKVN